jgi:membrane fusion protein, multidrug efflux system
MEGQACPGYSPVDMAMQATRRFRLLALLVLFVSLSGAGVYHRLNSASPGADGRLPGDGGLAGVSAADVFATDLALAVEGAPVVLDTLVLSVSAAGEAAAWRQTSLRAQVAGQVRSVRVAESGRVAGGALLMELDPGEYVLALEEAQARLRQTEAQYREITLGDDRIADAQLRAARDSAGRARSGLDGARVAVARAELNLARTRVTAPFAGTVANLRVVPGQHVAAGEELLTVLALDPIKVEAKVLEAEIGFLAAGRTAHVAFAAFPGEVFEGRIETINPVVEQQTRTARVTLVVRNPAARVLPGMYARAMLPARRFADRVMVPREAILERDGRTMLFVYEGDGTTGRARWRYVNTGLMNDRYVEILEEGPEDGMVRPGEVVLVGGHYTLVHDIPVRLVESARREGGRPQ